MALSICKLIQTCRKRTEDIKETDSTHGYVTNNNVNYGNYVEMLEKARLNGENNVHVLLNIISVGCVLIAGL